MQSQTRGVTDPPSSLKDWGAVPLSRSPPGRVIRGGTGVLSRFVPPLVCPAFCPAYFMQFYCITIHYTHTTRQPMRPAKNTQNGNQCAQNLIFQVVIGRRKRDGYIRFNDDIRRPIDGPGVRISIKTEHAALDHIVNCLRRSATFCESRLADNG